MQIKEEMDTHHSGEAVVVIAHEIALQVGTAASEGRGSDAESLLIFPDAVVVQDPVHLKRGKSAAAVVVIVLKDEALGVLRQVSIVVKGRLRGRGAVVPSRS